ncbi:MAG: glycosyltransferase [Myxococcota bacterium]|nr:glycosyltransferase [Myxococcota bacterium]
MRVALISTYPPAECGIGNYARELREAVTAQAHDVEVSVLAERTGVAGTDDGGVVRTWDRRGNWPREIAAAVARAGVDAVHIQHEESLFGQGRRFLGLLDAIRALGVRTVVTLHTVYDRRVTIPPMSPGRSFHRQLARACDAIVVHQHPGMGDVLLGHGVPAEQVHVIAHGTPDLVLPDATTARRALGLPDAAPIALFFGFIHRRKNVHIAVRAFERITARIPEARLVIAGRIRRSVPFDDRYARSLWLLMRRGIEAGRIIYRPGFIPADHKAAYFAAADVLLLPHGQPYGSASGVLHEALAARRAIVCSRGKKFAEATDVLCDVMPDAAPVAGDVAGWERALASLLGDEVARERVNSLVGELAASTSWRSSGQRHAAVYRSLADAKEPSVSPGARAESL